MECILELFGFVVGAWTLAVFALFFVAMVIGTMFDRTHAEAPKWWIFSAGLVAFLIWQYNNGATWRDLLVIPWGHIVCYALIGVAYSVVEFLIELRRSKRYWSKEWSDYLKNAKEDQATIVRDFVSRFGGNQYRIIGVVSSADKKAIEPRVNRKQLAENVGCWTIFWPFYLVSLVLGDLLREFFRAVADFIASISGRLVRVTFKDVFKF